MSFLPALRKDLPARRNDVPAAQRPTSPAVPLTPVHVDLGTTIQWTDRDTRQTVTLRMDANDAAQDLLYHALLASSRARRVQRYYGTP